MRYQDLFEVNSATSFKRMSSFDNDYKNLMKKHSGRADDVQAELKNFFVHKVNNNLHSQYNTRDTAFNSKSPLGGYMHVHLPALGFRPPLVLVYKVSGTVIHFYGLVPHSEYDTAKGAKKMARRYNNA